jgi:hypothetical protein
MSVTGIASPSESLSPESYELVELPANTAEDSDDDGNDIVLSPRTARGSHVLMQPSENPNDNLELDIEERDFVLVLPRSSMLSTPSVASPVLQREEPVVLDNDHDPSLYTTLNDDVHNAVSDDLGRLSIDATHSEEGSAKYPIFSENTSTATTPIPPSSPSFTVLEVSGQSEETQRHNQEAPVSSHHPPVKAGKPGPSETEKAKKRREQRKRAKARKAAALSNATNNPTQPSPSGQINKSKKNKSEKKKQNAKASEAGKVEPSGKRGKKAKAQQQNQTTSVPALPSLPFDEDSNEFYEEAVKYMDRRVAFIPNCTHCLS